jgi:class 3 adenylate cyclase/tetratricopeptide (TPR) repeat protein
LATVVQELPEGTVTVLFTDVEGSTDLTTRRGDEAAQEILRAQRELVRQQVERHSGHEVKSLGDGFMVAFASARRAVACAVGIQRALAEHNRRQPPDQQVRVRIGLNTGEVIQEEADLFGEAVNAAARIAAKAKGGQILVSETLRGVMGRAKDVDLVDRGRFRLKGFPERWRLFEVVWQEEGAVAPALLERTPFVGREAERAELRRCLDQVTRGQGALVMIGGEPGVGKTRLAEELLLEARQRGNLAWTGHCYEMEGAPPYIPFVEILKAATRVLPPAALRETLGDSAPEVAKLLPELRRLFPDIPPPLELPPEQERYYLFNSMQEFMERSGRAQPLLLVLEDLHWADDSTMLLLQHIAQRLHEMPMLILGTYRDVELDVARPLARALQELTRQRLAHDLALKRLPQAGVEAMLRALSGQEPPASLVKAVYRETEGNPFFVEEVFKHLAEEGKLFNAQGRWHPGLSIGELEVPRGVRLVIGHRLERVCQECRRVLTTAAVIGRGFSFEVLEALGEVEADVLLDALDEAERAHLIASASGGPEARFTFAHELIRQTLLSGLSLPRRQRLHLRVAEAMERVYARTLEEHTGDLAYHFHQAGAAADADKTLRYLALAGDQAIRAVAYEEGAQLYQMALEVLDRSRKPDEGRRCELLLALGEAQRRAGRYDRSKETFWSAANTARDLKRSDQLVQAAVGYGGPVLVPVPDPVEIDLLEEALETLGDADSALRARVLARLSLALYATDAWQREASVSQQAVDMARRIQDPRALIVALHARQFALFRPEAGPEAVHQRLLLADEMARLADETGEAEMALVGHIWLFMDSLELGDISTADKEIEVWAGLAEELRQPVYQHWARHVRAMRAIMDGRLEEGERLALEGLAIGQRAQYWSTGGAEQLMFAPQLVALRALQGRLSEVEPAVRASVAEYPEIVAWRAALAAAHSQLGREREARAEFEKLSEGDFAALPRDMSWLITLSNLAELCAYLGDACRAASLYELLLPYAGHNVIVGAPTVVCRGSASYDLGLLATTMGRWDDAARHFEDALRMNAKLGTRPWLARTKHDYAAMLIRRNSPGDGDKAFRLLTEAIAMYGQIGMPKHVEMAEALLSQL